MYLALARKYRPQTFEDLIGQPHITKTLQNAIKMDKLYAGLIFSGIKGVGKTSAARILSKALNCEKGPAVEPCNQCEACDEITQDKSPDYIEIDGASNNGVEEIRNLKERVKYKPLKNRYRVIVIDEVHMLSNSAWNALLKTIEEPPEHTYFIMATTDFHKIPATIVSRCQHFEFKRISQDVIITLLRQLCQKEEITISDYALFLVAKAADGSLRDAKKILDQSIALSESGNVKDQNVIDILGVIEEDLFIKLTQYIFQKDRKSIIQLINDLTERGMDLRFFYNEYLKFFRDLMVLKSLEDPGSLHNLNPENIPALKDILKNVREIELLRYFNAAKDMELTIRNTENPRIILEYLFLKLSYFPSLMSIEELIDRVGSGGLPAAAPAPPQAAAAPIQPQATAAPRPPHNPMERAVGAAGPAEPMDPQQIKSLLLKQVGSHKPRWTTALEAAAFELQNNKLTLRFPADFQLTQRSISENLDQFQSLLHDAARRQLEVELVVDKNLVTEEKKKMNELRNDKKITSLADKIKGKVGEIDVS